MHTREFDLTEIAERVLGKFKPMAAEKGIILATGFDRKEPAVALADSDRIEQVLMNLLDNAVRATPAGGKVELSLTAIQNEILVSVKDSGPGIPPGEQHLIWERFYKIDKSRTRSSSGTGLGLAIVKDIVEAHGGSVKVASKPGAGSTFTFNLPTKVNKS
ncbi:MAG: Alkaline phosphatase synthesis sensor protein PhoR [Pelotomaculum sp. PtaB.Bin104]|nr:MAG: Alkaline phosphatase synthesis sensor protein PhoR [Pelotomaculum sp. PtaB.Bin104]